MGLVGVADGADVAVVAGEQAGQLVLGVVGVLVLVDEDVAVAVGVLLADPVVAAQQGDGAQQQVVEVERAGAAQDLLVLLEAVDELRVAVAVLRGPQLLRGEHPVLPLADLPDQAARGQRVLVVVELLYREACGLELVGGVVDGEARRDVDVPAVGAQDGGRRRRGRWTAGRSARGCRAGGRAGRASRWRPVLVKVMPRMRSAGTVPERTSQAIRWQMTRVLPEPGPARMRSGPPGVAHCGPLFFVEAVEKGVGRVRGRCGRGWCELCHRRLSVPERVRPLRLEV